MAVSEVELCIRNYDIIRGGTRAYKRHHPLAPETQIMVGKSRGISHNCSVHLGRGFILIYILR
jgi:hypothetical protein